VKVIFENAYLADEQKVVGYQAAGERPRPSSRPAPVRAWQRRLSTSPTCRTVSPVVKVERNH
jgi:hypothetical protein